MGFDPKAYLAKKQAEQLTQPNTFDPKAYLASKQVQPAVPEKSFTERLMSEGMFAPGKGAARSEALARGELPSDIPMAANIPMTAGKGLIPKAAETVGGAIKAGAAEGALQGAGGSMREEDLGSRLGHTALGTGLGTIAGGIAGLIGAGAKASKDARLYSKPLEAARWAQGQFDDATTKLRELIKGKTDVVNKGVIGKSGVTNLQEIIDEAPELKPMVEEIMGRAKPVEASFQSSLGPTVKRVGDVVPGPDLLSLKRALDEENWKVRGVDTVVAKAKDKVLSNLANKMRTQINATDPEVAAANELMHTRASPLVERLTDKTVAESPMARLLTENAGPTLANADELVGTGLADAAHRMETASWLQLDPRKLLTIGAPTEVAKTLSRGAGLAAEGVSSAIPSGSKDAILATALAASAPKQKRK